jgi:hypothetical protein
MNDIQYQEARQQPDREVETGVRHVYDWITMVCVNWLSPQGDVIGSGFKFAYDTDEQRATHKSNQIADRAKKLTASQ